MKKNEILSLEDAQKWAREQEQHALFNFRLIHRGASPSKEVQKQEYESWLQVAVDVHLKNNLTNS